MYANAQDDDEDSDDDPPKNAAERNEEKAKEVIITFATKPSRQRYVIENNSSKPIESSETPHVPVRQCRGVWYRVFSWCCHLGT